MNKYEVVKRLLNLKERIDTFFLRIMEFLGYKYVCSNWQGMDNEYTLYWEVYVLKEFFPLVNYLAESYKEVLYVSDLERLLNKPIPQEVIIKVSGNVEFDSSYSGDNLDDFR